MVEKAAIKELSHSRGFGEAGFVDDVKESRRSKPPPYGLLSSSFHMVQGWDRDWDWRKQSKREREHSDVERAVHEAAWTTATNNKARQVAGRR